MSKIFLITCQFLELGKVTDGCLSQVAKFRSSMTDHAVYLAYVGQKLQHRRTFYAEHFTRRLGFYFEFLIRSLIESRFSKTGSAGVLTDATFEP